jgi:hypothetical protein
VWRVVGEEDSEGRPVLQTVIHRSLYENAEDPGDERWLLMDVEYQPGMQSVVVQGRRMDEGRQKVWGRTMEERVFTVASVVMWVGDTERLPGIPNRIEVHLVPEQARRPR